MHVEQCVELFTADSLHSNYWKGIFEEINKTAHMAEVKVQHRYQQSRS